MGRLGEDGEHRARVIRLSRPWLRQAWSIGLGVGLWCIGLGACAAPFEDTMAQRALACVGCHGPQGRAGPDGYYPRLAGKPAAYLYRQLLDFRDGRRHYPLMADLLAPLNDAYLLDLAQYFSALDLPYPATAPRWVPAPSRQEVLRGQQLALQGDAALKIPACSTCHGQALTGILPETPGLLGLPRDYLNAQLGAFRNGQRPAPTRNARDNAPHCMALVAQRLKAADVAAVSGWLATQALPANTQAVARQTPAPGILHGPGDLGGLVCAKPPSTAPATPIASVAVPTSTIPSPPTRMANASQLTSEIQRGAYLARVGNCLACHSQQGGAAYAGGRAIATPFGPIFSSNLTPDKTTGLGGWSKSDFWQAMHHGQSRSGRLLYPAFPYPNFTHITRQDADALFVFLQELPAVAAPAPPNQLGWPYNTQWALWIWRTLFFTPGAPPVDSQKSAAWNRGAYLAQGLGHCSACHASRNALGASASTADLTGNAMPLQNWVAPALVNRADAASPLWDSATLAALLKTGVSHVIPSHTSPGTALSGPMAEVVLGSTQFLSDADLGALVGYLLDPPESARAKTSGGTSSVAASPPGPAEAVSQVPPASLKQGEKIHDLHCAQCHGKRGQGISGAYPPLAGNRRVMAANPANLVQTVMRGGFAPATAGNPRPFGMPAYLLTLTDADIAAVLSYIRNAWGNQAEVVTEFNVNQIRNQTYKAPK